MTPVRGKLLVKPIETVETLPGGRIVLTDTTRKDLTAQQAEVVAVGLPSRCEYVDCERHHSMVREGRLVHESYLDPGQWILLAPRCLVETDEPSLYVCAQDDVLAVLQA